MIGQKETEYISGCVMKYKIFKRSIVLLTIFLASCATQPTPEISQYEISAPGFLLGFLHGFFMYFSFFIGLFGSCRIYAFPNSGNWYDFGFFLGVSLFHEEIFADRFKKNYLT